MTTVKFTIDDDRLESVERILKENPFVRDLEVGHTNQLQEPETPYEKLIKLQKEIGDRELFKEIKDPSAWQREIRKEWDRDF